MAKKTKTQQEDDIVEQQTTTTTTNQPQEKQKVAAKDQDIKQQPQQQQQQQYKNERAEQKENIFDAIYYNNKLQEKEILALPQSIKIDKKQQQQQQDNQNTTTIRKSVDEIVVDIYESQYANTTRYYIAKVFNTILAVVLTVLNMFYINIYQPYGTQLIDKVYQFFDLDNNSNYKLLVDKTTQVYYTGEGIVKKINTTLSYWFGQLLFLHVYALALGLFVYQYVAAPIENVFNFIRNFIFGTPNPQASAPNAKNNNGQVQQQQQKPLIQQVQDFVNQLAIVNYLKNQVRPHIPSQKEVYELLDLIKNKLPQMFQDVITKTVSYVPSVLNVIQYLPEQRLNTATAA